MKTTFNLLNIFNVIHTRDEIDLFECNYDTVYYLFYLIEDIGFIE